MIPTNFSKDIEVEVVFTEPLKTGEASVDADVYKAYFIFEFDKGRIWEVKLWQENDKHTLPLGTLLKFFVELKYPQSLFGKLSIGKEFEIWQGQTIGRGIILGLPNLEKRAQENIEHIILRPRDEVNQILDFNESLFGEPRFGDIFKNFHQGLKITLGMESLEDYLWLWEKTHRLHTFVEFETPKNIPKITQLLPDAPVPIWFLVDIDMLLSTWFLYDATFTALEQVLQKHKFSRYYIVAKDFSWVIRKINKGFMAIGNDVENKLKQFQIA